MKTTSRIAEVLSKVGRWRQAEQWLTGEAKTPGEHQGTDDGLRWAEIDGETFDTDDLAWLRRSAVLDAVEGIWSRTAWQEWPELCHEEGGPEHGPRADEIRMLLRTSDTRRWYVHCAVSSSGALARIGTAELRTFGNDADQETPADATVTVELSFEEAENLDWLTDWAIREHLP